MTDWQRLTPDLVRKVAAGLPQNQAAAALALVNKDAASALRGHFQISISKESDYSKIARQSWFVPHFSARWTQPERWDSLSHIHRLRLLCLAAASHHAPSLDAALALSGVGLSSEVLQAAAAAGDLAACKRLVQEGCDCSCEAATAAARHGHLHILQWIWADEAPYLQLRRGFEWAAAAAAAQAPAPYAPDLWQHAQMVCTAAEHGHTELLPRLLGADGRYARQLRWWTPAQWFEARCSAAFGCPAPFLERVWHEWPRPQGHGVEPGAVGEMAALLSAALCSPTDDWRAKADFLCGQMEGPREAAATAAATEATATAAAGAGGGAQLGQAGGGEGTAAAGAVVADVAAALMRDLCVDDMGNGNFMIALNWREAAALSEYAARWRYLAARAPVGGAADGWQVHASRRAAEAGNAAALSALLDDWQAAGLPPCPTLASSLNLSAGTASVAALQELQRHAALTGFDRLSLASVQSSSAAAGGKGVGVTAFLAGLEGLVEEGSPEAVARTWGEVFRDVAAAGADMALLRLLYERRGAAIDLAAVAKGGCEEALGWAVGELQAQQHRRLRRQRQAAGAAPQHTRQPQTAPPIWLRLQQAWELKLWQVSELAAGGKLAAAAWLLDRGLVEPPEPPAEAPPPPEGGSEVCEIPTLKAAAFFRLFLLYDPGMRKSKLQQSAAIAGGYGGRCAGAGGQRGRGKSRTRGQP
ncbi:hypothetical protein HXX76_013181 [Chlamydomonas incerta]|uniref:Uncharacterized protein n=1 Tax=Chlamydomonas incerta TaxID=51695 RepID=A0A835ST75_CHLIN|nr:hypothetical protein HXX76_013181 [Chlamydomonas incerta]|eukprot:KAG2426200.1 hypothetical protein HXX76_013181 [Chlamydomonas incerta]